MALGCAEDVGCDGHGVVQIGQSIRSTGALAVLLHFVKVGGNVVIDGGGGGVTCEPNEITQGPAYVVVEDSTIGQSVQVTNLESCWLGIIRDKVGGSVTDQNNTFADPDANEIVTNRIGQSLNCSGNSPAAQQGDSEGAPNIVGGHKNGECAAL